MNTYVVRSGEDVMSIAHAFGCEPDAVWNLGENADLKKLRGDPNILCAGDVLYIPDPTPKNWLSVNVGDTNKFAASLPTITTSLNFIQEGKPLAGVACIVHGMPPPNQLTTDGAGTLVLTLPIHTRTVVIEFPSIPFIRTFRVGHLDPVSTPSGVRQRLRNLGHHPSLGSADYLDDAALRQATSDFQQAQGLTVTGEIDDTTRTALASAHGA